MAHAQVSTPVHVVVERLHDVEGWPRFVGGLGGVRLGDRDVTLSFSRPRPLSLCLELDRTSRGLTYAMIQGDLADAAGRIEATEAEGGTRLTWEGAVLFPVDVPAVLLNELTRHVFPGWLASLGR